MKPSVRYERNSLVFIRVGVSAFLIPKDHYSRNVSNTTMVRTSPVVTYNPETGALETENTAYIPE